MSIPHVGPTEEFPNRPDSEDFDILSALVIALDQEVDEAGPDFNLDKIVSRYLDPESLTYLAMQRAIRSLRITTKAQVMAHTDQVMKMATMYHEGFIMGCRYQQTKQKPIPV